MLKFKINKAAYDKLSDELKGEYEADGDEFVLAVDGLPAPEDTGPLKRALQNEKDRHKTTKGEKDALQLKLDEVPDVEKLKTDHEKEVGKYKTFAEKTLRENVANGIAGKISNSPKLLAPHILNRLGVDMSGDEPKTVVLGADGKPDANLTVEKLSSEFVANKDFAAIIIGSKASGGGAPRTPTKPSAGAAGQGDPSKTDDGKPIDIGRAKPTDIRSLIDARVASRANPAPEDQPAQ